MPPKMCSTCLQITARINEAITQAALGTTPSTGVAAPTIAGFVIILTLQGSSCPGPRGEGWGTATPEEEVESPNPSLHEGQIPMQRGHGPLRSRTQFRLLRGARVLLPSSWFR